MCEEDIRRSFADFEEVLRLGIIPERDPLNEKSARRSSKADSGSSSEYSSDESDYEAEYNYSSLSDCVVQFIMVEYSDGLYNNDWLKFYFRNEHFRATVKKRFLAKLANKEE
jgi:hypothetical protein